MPITTALAKLFCFSVFSAVVFAYFALTSANKPSRCVSPIYTRCILRVHIHSICVYCFNLMFPIDPILCIFESLFNKFAMKTAQIVSRCNEQSTNRQKREKDSVIMYVMLNVYVYSM